MIPAGRLPDKYHNGVPADHFPKAQRHPHRFHDPLLATMAAIAAATGAVMKLETECEECDQEEHFGSTAKSTTTKPWDGAASRFTDEQYKMATAACDPNTGTDDGPSVKQGCFLPHHEPDGTINVNGVHAAAQRASSVSGHDSGAVSKAKSHLRSHYAKLKEDPPDSIKASADAQQAYADVLADIERLLSDDAPTERRGLGEMFAGLHEKFSGTHSHAHAAYGQQGGDQTHEHSHTHDDDNLHRHDHAEGASTDGEPVAASGKGRRPQLRASFRRAVPAEAEGWWESTLAGLAFVAGAQPGSVDPMLGSSWAVKQNANKWHVLTASGPWKDPVGSYAEALAVIAQQLAEQGDSRPVLDQGWKSEMAFEGVPTGDGRFIENGAIGYRNCPLPLMLQTETEPGHFGAVLAGAIMQTGKIGQVAIGAGNFDASDAGRQFLQIILARGKFGVSIDVSQADGYPVCDEHGTDTEQCDWDCDWEVHFTMLQVMGLTGTPFPAFEDAYIEVDALPAQATAASGTPETMSFTDGDKLNQSLIEAMRRPIPGEEPVTAAAARNAKSQPPVGYFSLPDHWGDLLCPQPSGGQAVPLVVEDPDENGWRRVYGHVADKLTCHTGIPDRCQRAPMSRDGKYPGFNLKPIMTAEGELVNVGHITMGCGHASTTMRLTPDQVRAHYDGAPGALDMAWVHAGQDDHGPWIAGVINPARTDEEVEQFAMCSMSGDWRREWPQRGYDLFAVLAGVYVPGFPIAAAASLVAAGLVVPGSHIPDEPAYETDDDGEPLALIAMGIVRQPLPWEREMTALRRDRDELAARLEATERVTSTLRPLAAATLTARIEGRDPLETFAAPTNADKAVSTALQQVLAALNEAIAAQAKDPDNGTDPDDAVVDSDLKHLQQALQKTIADHAKDAAQDAPEPANA